MATRRFKGDAQITYTPLGDSSEIAHQLAVPLLLSPAQGFRPAQRQRAWRAWNATGSERVTFKLGDPVYEISATIRFDDEPNALMALLDAGLNDNVELTYWPNSGIYFPCLLVAISGAADDEVAILPDRERFGFGEWEVSVLLRRVDGGDFSELLGSR